MRILLLLTSMLFLLNACSNSPKQLKGPCTYQNRSGCGGAVILMQQADIMRGVS